MSACTVTFRFLSQDRGDSSSSWLFLFLISLNPGSVAQKRTYTKLRSRKYQVIPGGALNSLRPTPSRRYAAHYLDAFPDLSMTRGGPPAYVVACRPRSPGSARRARVARAAEILRGCGGIIPPLSFSLFVAL